MWNFIQYVNQEIKKRESEEFCNKYSHKIVGRLKLRLTKSITGEIERYPEEREIIALIEEYKAYDLKQKE